jgi:DGQHR domain-containing protein|tara:strand:- start:162 stop:881 length:720 start_codon:yes stop_codon:yes gene_type:complete
MNIRKRNLSYKKNELIIGDDAVFHIVDGQHRIAGLKMFKKKSYEVPVTILENLNENQEAAQFLVINSSQKAVDPQLQLRVIYKSDTYGINKLLNEVKKVIPWQAWKLKALKIAIALEKEGSSPWYDLIKIPNEEIGSGEWKPLREGSFLDSLRAVCSGGNPIEYLDDDKKIMALIEYWKSIKKIYPEAFNNKTGIDYLLTKGIGAGVFNTFFPNAYTLLLSGVVKDFDEVLIPIKKVFL